MELQKLTIQRTSINTYLPPGQRRNKTDNIQFPLEAEQQIFWGNRIMQLQMSLSDTGKPVTNQCSN